MRPAQRKYFDTKMGECLGIVSALETFRNLILHTPFILETDHANLRWLRQAKWAAHTGQKGQLARWAMAVDEYDFRIRHRRGKDMLVADALSRDPAFESCELVRDRRELMPEDLLLERRPPEVVSPSPDTWVMVLPRVGPVLRSHTAAVAAGGAPAVPEAGALAAGPQLWEWADSDAAKAVTRSLLSSAATAQRVHLPSWAEMGWGDPPHAEADLLPQVAELRVQQLADAHAGPILRWLETGEAQPGVSAVVQRRLAAQAELYRVVGRLLYYVLQVAIFDDARALQLVIPAAARERLLR